jgi:predicted O-methyltransferase YrrM
MNKNISKKDLLDKVRQTEGWLSDHEALLLYNIAKLSDSDADLVEIGSWKGKSTICLGYGLNSSGKAGSIWAVDPHEGKLKAADRKAGSTLAEFRENIRSNGLNSRVREVVKTSADAAKDWHKSVKILFIDGIHDYPNTSTDIKSWQKFVLPGGVTAFHDAFCGEAGVWKAVSQYFLTGQDLIDIGTVSSILYGIKGHPNFLQSVTVNFKISLIRFAVILNGSWLPYNLKMFIIHKCIRIFLLNKYSMAVYL